MKKPLSVLLSATAVLLLGACGGGSSSDAGVPAGPYAVNAALQHLLVAGGSWTMSGSANGQSVTVTVAVAPAASGPFPIGNIASSQALETITIASATASSSATQTIYFNATTGAFVGLQASGLCSVATANTALPASASIGASGAIFSESDFNGCASNSTLQATATNSWSLQADTGIAILCWNVLSMDLSGASNGSESTCVQVAPDGTLGTKASFAFSASGVAISARNF